MYEPARRNAGYTLIAGLVLLGFGLMTVAYVSYLFSVFSGRRYRVLTEEQKLTEGL
jgi:hypothetical protein